MLQTYITDLKLQIYVAKLHIKINKEEADWGRQTPQSPTPNSNCNSKNMGIVLFYSQQTETL